MRCDIIYKVGGGGGGGLYQRAVATLYMYIIVLIYCNEEL